MISLLWGAVGYMPKDDGGLRKPGQPDIYMAHRENHGWPGCAYEAYVYQDPWESFVGK